MALFRTGSSETIENQLIYKQGVGTYSSSSAGNGWNHTASTTITFDFPKGIFACKSIDNVTHSGSGHSGTWGMEITGFNTVRVSGYGMSYNWDSSGETSGEVTITAIGLK